MKRRTFLALAASAPAAGYLIHPRKDPTMDRALHMIHSLAQLDDPMPAPHEAYTIVIANSGFNYHELAKIRDRFPNAEILASINAHSVPHYGENNPPLMDLRERMRPHVALSTDGWNDALTPGNRGSLIRFSLEAAEEFARWVAGWLDHFDGTYIDEAFGDELPPWLDTILSEEVDARTPLLHRWRHYRDHLLESLDNTGLRIVNSAGWYPEDGLVDGISIESGHGKAIKLLPIFQRAAAAGCTMNIHWRKMPEGSGLDSPGTVMTGDRI